MTKESKRRRPDSNRTVRTRKATTGALNGRKHVGRFASWYQKASNAPSECTKCTNPGVRSDGLTPAQVADELGVSLGAVYRLCRGPLRAYRLFGRALRVQTSDLAAYRRSSAFRLAIQ